jgi:hypothetical protein
VFSGSRIPADKEMAVYMDAWPLESSGPDRLPWPVAVPMIGFLSLGLWLGMWELASLVLEI